MANDINKELSILEIVREDILRILGEKNKKILLKSLKSEIIVSNSFISRAIREFEEENLVQLDENFIELTQKGKNYAKNIIEKHLILENYFKKTRSKREAHKITDILEHYISEEVIGNIKKLFTFKKKGILLTEFKLEKRGIITDIMFSDYGLFERIVSMGIFPGEKILIINKIPNGIVVRIKNKKFVLDKNIAKKIKVLECKKL